MGWTVRGPHPQPPLPRGEGAPRYRSRLRHRVPPSLGGKGVGALGLGRAPCTGGLRGLWYASFRRVETGRRGRRAGLTPNPLSRGERGLLRTAAACVVWLPLPLEGRGFGG